MVHLHPKKRLWTFGTLGATLNMLTIEGLISFDDNLEGSPFTSIAIGCTTLGMDTIRELQKVSDQYYERNP